MDELKIYQKMYEIVFNELMDEEDDKEYEFDCKTKKTYNEDEGGEKYAVHSIECTKIEESDVRLLDNISEKKFYGNDGFGHPLYKAEIFISQIDSTHRKIHVLVTDDYDPEEYGEYEYENALVKNLKESGHYY